MESGTNGGLRKGAVGESLVSDNRRFAFVCTSFSGEVATSAESDRNTAFSHAWPRRIRKGSSNIGLAHV